MPAPEPVYSVVTEMPGYFSMKPSIMASQSFSMEVEPAREMEPERSEAAASLLAESEPAEASVLAEASVEVLLSAEASALESVEAVLPQAETPTARTPASMSETILLNVLFFIIILLFVFSFQTFSSILTDD